MKKKLFLVGLLAVVLSVASACGGGIKDESFDSHGSNSSVTESAEDGESSVEDSGNSSVTESAEDGESSVEDSDLGADSDEKNEDGENTETYHTVTFDTDGGNIVESVSVRHGEKIAKPNVPVKSSMSCEYEFLGWFFDGEVWDFENDTVTESITLVAHWKVVDKYTEPFLPKD